MGRIRSDVIMTAMSVILIMCSLIYYINKGDIPNIYTTKKMLLNLAPFKKGYCPTCEVVDLSKNVNEQFPCIQMTFEPPTPVCMYPNNVDVFVSTSLNKTGKWETAIVEGFQGWLREYPTSGVIDVGTNIGVYSLVAAAMGRDVVSIEPNIHNLKRFHKAITMGKLENRITLLHNAISDEPETGQILLNRRNQGATQIVSMNDSKTGSADDSLYAKLIVMNDITKYCRFTDAIMKIDIEGFEHRAFAHADILFDQVSIHRILMEWRWMTPLTNSHDLKLVANMVEFLGKRNFVARDWSNNELTSKPRDKWPANIVWHKQ